MYPICIVLPVYNGMKYLKQSVISVLNQEFENFELLIIDDCSTDGSKEYLQSLADKRITLFINEKNKGLFYNLNFLIKNSNSTIIKLWAQDDIMYPECLQEVVDFHKKNLQIGFSYTGRDYINAKGELLHINKKDDTPAIISTSLHTKIAFYTGSIAGNIANVAINKVILDEVGPFNEKMKISGDFEMWVRLAKNYPVGFINKPLIQLRNHKEQLSGQEKYYSYHLKEDIEAYKILFGYITIQQRTEGKKILREKKLLFYYTLMLKALLKGKLKIAFSFIRMMSELDNFFIITWFFVVRRIFSSKQK